MKIVFIDPKGVWEGLNNGIAYLATVLRDKHSVKVVDFVNRNGDEDKRLEVVKGADFVGISIKSFTLVESIRLANKVKKLNPTTKIIAGGPHIIVDGNNFMKENDVFDLGIKGEGEFVINDIIDGKDKKTIPGLLYRENNQIKENPKLDWYDDLDKLPFPIYDDFDSINVNGKLKKIEKWPMVTSRGCPYTCTYCFPEGTLIHTDKGFIKIEELINVEAKTLSHSGNFKNVKNNFVRQYSGKLVKIKPYKMPIIKATKNHKFHILRNGIKIEIPAEQIIKTDYLIVQLPKIVKTEQIDVKNIIKERQLVYEYSRKVPIEKIKIAIELGNNGYSTRNIANVTGLSKSYVASIIKSNPKDKKTVENNLEIQGDKIRFRLSESIPAKIKITKDFCRLIGYYLAEGSTSKHKRRPNSYEISWTFNKKEKTYIEDVKNIVKTSFNLEPRIINQNNVTRIYISNSVLGILLLEMFGKDGKNKHLPDYLMSLEPIYLQEILRGWLLGDGGFVKYRDKMMIKGSTISDSLAYQMFLISIRLGLYPSLQKNETKDSVINGRILKTIGYNYHLSFKSKEDFDNIKRIMIGEEIFIANNLIRDEDRFYIPIKEIDQEDFEGNVYNIEVENDHTYTANGFLVNNCNVPTVIGRRFRTRTGDNIMAELNWAREKYGCDEFKVLDDNFTLKMDRAKDICNTFIDKNLNMKWTCPNGIRADRLDDELCVLMKKAGCYAVSIGVESGDPEVFLKIKKGERLEDVEKGIKCAQKAGLKVHGFFILGLMGSTYETDKKSMEFAKKMGISASWGILVPYPGTEVWEQVKADKKSRILRDWKEGFHIGARPKPVYDTEEYPAEERVKAYYKANMMFVKKRDIPRAAKMFIKGLIAGK